MPFVKVYIHLVWSTKNRVPFLATKEIRQNVWNHIKENAKTKNIFVDFVNGYDDHCHCLVSLGVDQNIQKVVQLIKGESSFWINKDETMKSQISKYFSDMKFGWQDEYYAVSVSESMIEIVRNYIKNQEEHHKNKTSKIELYEFIEKHGFKRISENDFE